MTSKYSESLQRLLNVFQIMILMAFCRCMFVMDVDKPQNLPLYDLPPNKQTWALQQVSTLATRKIVIAWMLEDEALRGIHGLPAYAVHTFPEHF